MRGLNQNMMDVRRSNSIAMEHIKTEEHWPNNLVSTWGMQSIHVFAEKNESCLEGVYTVSTLSITV